MRGNDGWIALGLSLAACVFAAVTYPAGADDGTPPAGHGIVGTWLYEAVDNVNPDGSRVPLFGPHPHGMAVFDASGHYMLVTSRAGMAKFAVNNRMEGTPDENRAVVQGSIAHFGTYSVDDAAHTIRFHIDTSTFPNWNGAEQVRPFTLAGDELRWTTAASNGGSAEVVLKRAH